MLFFCFTGAGGDSAGLAQGYDVERNAVPHYPWPSWVGLSGGEGRGSLLFPASTSHKLVEVEPGAYVLFFDSVLVHLRLCWQDMTRTAYIFEGGDLPPLLGWLQQELGV